MCKRRYGMNRAKEKQLKERRKRIDTFRTAVSSFAFLLLPRESSFLLRFSFFLFRPLSFTPTSIFLNFSFFFLSHFLSFPLPSYLLLLCYLSLLSFSLLCYSHLILSLASSFCTANSSYYTRLWRGMRASFVRFKPTFNR